MNKIKSLNYFLSLLLIILNIYSVEKISAQSVVINEIMSSNSSIIADEDNEYHDWIEIFNSGATAVNLNGFGLSDSLNLPFNWTFPDVNIRPGQFLFG